MALSGPKKSSLVAGKYKIRSKLGSGSCGTVYRATHVDLGADVALKLLNSDVATNDAARKRFLREVQLTTSFVHKYAVQLRDFGRDSERDRLYFTMDLIEGVTLRKFLEMKGTVSERTAVYFGSQILEAIHEAHRAGIVHRDLKPANILVTRGHKDRAEIRILDFGIAKAISTSRTSGGDLTVAGLLLGTPRYMSPEQAQGLELDGRSDLYSVAVILYEMLSGRIPSLPARNPGDVIQALLYKIANEPPQDLCRLAPSVSREVGLVVMRQLGKDPAGRLGSAHQFRKALRMASNTALRRRKEDARGNDELDLEPLADGWDDSNEAGDSSERSYVELFPSQPAKSGRGKKSRRLRASRSEGQLAKVRSGRLRQARAETEREGSNSSRTTRIIKLPPNLRPSEERGEFINQTDGSILVYVPPGSFTMGARRRGPPSAASLPLPEARLYGENRPEHTVKVARGYFIGKLPVSWKQYRRFCKETGREAPTRVDFPDVTKITDKHPAVNVNWHDSRAYCRWAGLRLPSEEEWEFAARGTDGRLFPWGGEEVGPEHMNWEGHPLFGRRSTCQLGIFPAGVSPYGCLDMSGNVCEWTGDSYADYPGAPRTEPRASKAGQRRVIRGGSWLHAVVDCQTTSRGAELPNERRNWLGFRVCVAAPERGRA